MKTSVPIILSFVVGALVTFALAARGPLERAPEPPETLVAGVEVAAVTSAPTTRRAPTKARQNAASNGPARIAIPSLHLTAEIGMNLDEGPVWWPVTGRPGGNDTIAIAGHRTTHTHPFLDLDRLEPGNAIYVRWHGASYRYVMSGRRILSSRDQHIADARGHELLLLTACTPKGSARQRIVIYALPDRTGKQSASKRS